MEKNLIQNFKEIYQSPPEVISSAPGRINIIGEHTDYNQGYVLPAAIHFRNYFLASKSDEERVRIFTENFKEKEAFSIRKIKSSKDKSWINYIKGIFWILIEQGFTLQGINGYISSDIPLDAGLSSSAALEISVLNGLNSLFKLNLSREKLARLAQKAENDFVGVKCGIMDQYISLFGKKNSALFLDCETLQFELIPLELEKEGLSLLVYESGVRRELAFSAYNKRREESMRAFEFLKELGVKSYKKVNLRMFEKRKGEMDKTLCKRARHVISENERVKKAVEALKKDDFFFLGELLFHSHESLRDDYQVSCPELDLLYESGKKFSGCLGARLTGAGFGGSGIALIKKEKIEVFKKEILGRGRKMGFPRPSFYEVEIGDGAEIFKV